MTNQLIDSLGAPSESQGKWAAAAWQLGVEVAGPAASDVDVRARFPQESLDALREGRFLSALLPATVGGGDASLAEMVGAVRALATHCASSALVLAMHCIEIVNLNRHGTTEGLRSLAGEIAEGELLIANANSEVGLGGDVGRSLCALDVSQSPWTIDKQALAISYGEAADIIMATARRSPDASETDQAFVALRARDATLTPLSQWDTLGLRGTCSRGYALHASVDESLIFPAPFSVVANDGGGQSGQLLRSAVWVGLSEAAAARAHAYVRAAARKSIGTVPPGAIRLAEIAAAVQEVRSLLAANAQLYEACDVQGDLENAGLTIGLRNLKVTTSETAARVATAALGVCGISGYQRESPFSLDRLIRDAHGGLIMVSNDRYLNDNAQLLLARKNI
jgi:acyl-CoA dehydrogenase